jgi:hypothetical protein
MAISSLRYGDDPDCQAFEARMEAINAETRPQWHHANQLVDWPAAVSEVERRTQRMIAAAEETLRVALAARGLVLTETWSDQGCFVDLAPLTRADTEEDTHDRAD